MNLCPRFPALTLSAVLFLAFLFLLMFLFLNVEQAVHVRLDRLQFLVLLAQPLVILIGCFLFIQQGGILCLKRFDCRQLLHALGVKGTFRRFMEEQVRFMGSPESRLVSSFFLLVGNISVPCFGVVDDVGL